MKAVRIVNNRFGITEASSFIREERGNNVRIYEVIDYSPYAIIGKDIHTRETKAFRPHENRTLAWV